MYKRETKVVVFVLIAAMGLAGIVLPIINATTEAKRWQKKTAALRDSLEIARNNEAILAEAGYRILSSSRDFIATLSTTFKVLNSFPPASLACDQAKDVLEKGMAIILSKYKLQTIANDTVGILLLLRQLK